MNYLLTEDQVLESKFFVFFISCCNLVKFYAKKDKEYNPKLWEKWINTKTEIPRLNPTKIPPTLQKPLTRGEADNTKQQQQETQIHQFLEGASPVLLTHQKILERLFKIIEQLKLNLKDASQNMKQIGELFSNLGEGYSEIEKAQRPELEKIKPSLSHLYVNLKKSVFQMSNSLEQKLNIFKRFFERNLADISDNGTHLISTISIRDESVKRLTLNVELAKHVSTKNNNSELVRIMNSYRQPPENYG